jgi:hypothetical protein
MTSSADACPSPVRHDLKSRPACHRKREYTGAHLSIVFTALTVLITSTVSTPWPAGQSNGRSSAKVPSSDDSLTSSPSIPSRTSHAVNTWSSGLLRASQARFRCRPGAMCSSNGQMDSQSAAREADEPRRNRLICAQPASGHEKFQVGGHHHAAYEP